MGLDLDAVEDLDTPFYDLDGNRVLYLFTPNIAFDMGPINPDTTGNQRRLMGQKLRPHGRFVTVWKLPDGSYSEVQPYPLVLPEFAQQGNLPQGQMVAVTYVKVYYTAEVVSLAEAANLTAHGYGGNLS